MGAPIVEYFAYTVTTPMATLAARIVSKDCPCEWHEHSVQAPLHRCTGCASQMDQTAFALDRTPGESATRPTGNGDGDSGDSGGDGALGPRYGSMAD